MYRFSLLLIMITSTFFLTATGNQETDQYSGDLIIRSNNEIKDAFKIIRESKLGQEIITIISSTDTSYKAIEFEVDNDYNHELSTNITFNATSINAELKSLKTLNYTGSKENVSYNPDKTTFGFKLINSESPQFSYALVLDLTPTININTEDEEMLDLLTTNDDLREYLKKEVLGSNTFNGTESNPFPISDLDSSSESIYDRLQSDSLLKQFITLYFNKNKPLFYSYINDFVDNFDYEEYVCLTEEEGKELAEHALKYLTWGLEYTPKTNVRALNTNNNIYPSQLIDYNPELKEWITENNQQNNETSKQNNYLPYSPNPCTEVINIFNPTYSNTELLKQEDIGSNLQLTTPFITDSKTVTGSALPYVKGGIDSPRTFNYKMYRQKYAINNYFNITLSSFYGKTHLAKVNNHLFSFNGFGQRKRAADYYFFIGDNTSGLIDPFNPGLIGDAPYTGLTLTGIDSLGMLTGAISMTSFYDRIFDLDNNAKAKELDAYNQMSTLPLFDGTDEDDINNLRFNRGDLERSTVIVPDLSKIQIGDLLVNRADGITDVAIVVKASSEPENVIVLAVNEKTGRVGLHNWLNSSGDSTFTDNPKDYLIRRIIKFDGDLDNLSVPNKEDIWDPFNYRSKTLKAIIDIDNRENYDRWIPNTGEFFIINNITIEDDSQPLEGNNIPVTIISPTDLNYSTESDSSNIDNNRGDGFEFYALNTTNGIREYIKLATFNLNSSSQSRYDAYTVISEDNFDLTYNDGLIFTSGDKTTSTFAIRPLKNNIRPGDDILLNFELTIENHIETAECSEEDFLAVYDKKLLWRANLYINEGTAQDWNNLYPWNAPPTTQNLDPNLWYGCNEWNLSYNGEQRLNPNDNDPEPDYYIQELIQGDGTQVVDLLPFTYHPAIDGANNSSESKVVSYAYGCNDSPFEFNDELRQLQSLNKEFYNTNREKFLQPKSQWPTNKTVIDDFTAQEDYETYIQSYPENNKPYPEQAIELESYNKSKTTAIDNNWNNYITPFNILTITEETNQENINNKLTNYDNNKSFPFLPGYALKYHLEHANESNYQSPPDWANAISAGVDCIGLISRAASYTNNPYKWQDVQQQSIKQKKRFYTPTTYPNTAYSGDAYLITSESDKDITGTYKNLNKIKPGDLMQYNSKHIAMVQNVNNTNEIVTAEDIILIESTWKEDSRGKVYWAKVYNQFNLKTYINQDWKIVRLREK